MTADIREIYLNEIAKHMAWNPEDNQDDLKVKLDEAKFRHVIKRYINATSPSSAGKIEKLFGDTLYKALDFGKMPGLNQVFLITGKITIDQFVKLYEDGLTERGKYKFFIEDGETFVKNCEEAFKELWLERSKVSYAPSPTSGPMVILTSITGGMEVAINSLLKESGNPEFSAIQEAVDKMSAVLSDKEDKEKEARKLVEQAAKELKEAKETISDLTLKALVTPVATFEVSSSDDIPEGHVVMRKASDIFNWVKGVASFEIPTWVWDAPNPRVPAIDPNYIFRAKELNRVLLALATNRRMYLHGDTGSGKTTLIEQVAAHIGYMSSRINFDSEITRPDLIGRDTLTYEDGKQVSKFVDGILPKVMSGPYIAIFDEIDFARPDVAYVMQAALEGSALRITEDGDRIVNPHPYFRMFGTGNTVGQGDERGMYQGARVQSLAFMNRFSIFAHVEYLDKKDRKTLIEKTYPSLGEGHKEQLLKYIDEHLKAFEQGEIILPISPRGFLGAAMTTIITGSLKEALESTFVDAASEQDRQVIIGIIDRVTK